MFSSQLSSSDFHACEEKESCHLSFRWIRAKIIDVHKRHPFSSSRYMLLLSGFNAVLIRESFLVANEESDH